MKLGVYKVWYHTITEKDGKEVSRTSPVIKMVAAENEHKILDALPKPHQEPGTCTRNVITQIDQKHRDVLYAWQPLTS